MGHENEARRLQNEHARLPNRIARSVRERMTGHNRLIAGKETDDVASSQKAKSGPLARLVREAVYRPFGRRNGEAQRVGINAEQPLEAGTPLEKNPETQSALPTWESATGYRPFGRRNGEAQRVGINAEQPLEAGTPLEKNPETQSALPTWESATGFMREPAGTEAEQGVVRAKLKSLLENLILNHFDDAVLPESLNTVPAWAGMAYVALRHELADSKHIMLTAQTHEGEEGSEIIDMHYRGEGVSPKEEKIYRYRNTAGRVTRIGPISTAQEIGNDYTGVETRPVGDSELDGLTDLFDEAKLVYGRATGR